MSEDYCHCYPPKIEKHIDDRGKTVLYCRKCWLPLKSQVEKMENKKQ